MSSSHTALTSPFLGSSQANPIVTSSPSQSRSSSLSTASSSHEVTVPTLDVGQALGGLFSQLIASQSAASEASIEADRAVDARIEALEETVRQQSKVIAALQQTILAQNEANKAEKEANDRRHCDLIGKLTYFEHRFVNHFHEPFPQQPRGATFITMTADEVRNKRPQTAKTSARDNTKKIVYEIGRQFPEFGEDDNFSLIILDRSEDHEA